LQLHSFLVFLAAVNDKWLLTVHWFVCNCLVYFDCVCHWKIIFFLWTCNKYRQLFLVNRFLAFGVKIMTCEPSYMLTIIIIHIISYASIAKSLFDYYITNFELFCSEDLRRWLITQEVDLFRYRFLSLKPDEVQQFLQSENLLYLPVSCCNYL